MLARLLRRNTIIEVLDESFEEDKELLTCQIKVLPGMVSSWLAALREILEESEDEESKFTVEASKNYFLTEKNILVYRWFLVLEGDISDAVSCCASAVLSTKPQPEPQAGSTKVAPLRAKEEAVAASPTKVKSRHKLVQQKILEDGTELRVVSVPIPFSKKGSRYRSLEGANATLTIHNAHLVKNKAVVGRSTERTINLPTGVLDD